MSRNSMDYSTDAPDEALLGRPANSVRAPWTAEQIYRLNRRQEDPRLPTHRCPWCGVSLFATCGGWMCARRPAHFRQDWVLTEDIDCSPPRLN